MKLARLAASVIAAPLLAACLLLLAAPAAAAAPQDVEDPPVDVENDEPAPPAEDEAQEEIQEPDPPAAVEAPPAAAGSDIDIAQATMGRLLEVGRALHSWARDTRLERGRRQPTARLPKQVRWDRCPGISHAELTALLVPAYLREVPQTDAWERPLEFCLDQRLSGAAQQYGVRSAGTDGSFSEGAPYQVGGFPESELASDLVWMDGYFIRWPEPQ